MAAIKYKIKLTGSERTCLNEVSHRGKAPVRTVKRALALLKADEGLRDREIADVLLVNAATVARARKRFVEEGLEAAINDRPRPGQERKLDGKQEAHLIAFACSAAPEGHTHWTLQLLADKVVELEFAESISLETVRQILKKTNSSPGRRKSGVSSGSSWRGWRTYNPERPIVCFRDLQAIDWGGASAHRGCPPDGWHAMTPSTSA